MLHFQNEWYERSWLGWAANHTLTDLHPTVPEAFKRVRSQPLFQLTPALRILYLDAKKGRTTGTRSDTATARGPTSSLNTSEHGIPESDADGTASASGGGDNLYSGGGCEGTPHRSWTESQRMMCLVPDVDDGASPPLRRGRPTASIGRKYAKGDFDQAEEASVDDETRASEEAGEMDTPAVQGAAEEGGLPVERSGLGVEVLRPTLGEVFREGKEGSNLVENVYRRTSKRELQRYDALTSCVPLKASVLHPDAEPRQNRAERLC